MHRQWHRINVIDASKAMTDRSIVVFEHRPWWVPELQRRLADEPVRVTGTPSEGDFERLLPGADVAVLVLEGASAACLQILGRWHEHAASPSFIVIGNPSHRELEWAVRELGAATVLDDTVTGEALAAVCQRHINRRGRDAPPARPTKASSHA
jgi:hypothetical protein